MDGIGAVAFGAVVGWWTVLVAGGRPVAARWPAFAAGLLVAAVPAVLVAPVGGLALPGALAGGLAHAGFLAYAGRVPARRETGSA